MSTTETDFWSRIDSAQAADDAAAETDQTPHREPAPAEASSGEASAQALASPNEEPPQAESPAAETRGDETRGDGARGDGARGDETRGDETRGVAAEASARVARPADEGPPKSKSQRIREFLSQHSEVRNRDVVEALGGYGVTAADVANVRSQLRKKAEKQQKAKARVQSPAASQAGGTPRRRKAPASASGGGGGGLASADREPIGEIAISEIEAGLTFIERAGSIERARQVIDLVARIREINVNR